MEFHDIDRKTRTSLQKNVKNHGTLALKHARTLQATRYFGNYSPFTLGGQHDARKT